MEERDLSTLSFRVQTLFAPQICSPPQKNNVKKIGDGRSCTHLSLMLFVRQERLLWTTLGLAVGATSFLDLKVRRVDARTRAKPHRHPRLFFFPQKDVFWGVKPTAFCCSGDGVPSEAKTDLTLHTSHSHPPSPRVLFRSALFGAPPRPSRTSSRPRPSKPSLFR